MADDFVRVQVDLDFVCIKEGPKRNWADPTRKGDELQWTELKEYISRFDETAQIQIFTEPHMPMHLHVSLQMNIDSDAPIETDKIPAIVIFVDTLMKRGWGLKTSAMSAELGPASWRI